MPSLQQLRYLVALADTLNFSRAAERMSVTQPTLSMQIRELEDRLGASLVERNRARVILTPTGADVAQRARQVLVQVDDIRQAAALGQAGDLQGTLKIGAVHTIGAYLLSVAMPALRRTYPALRLYVREDHPESLPRQLAEGSHDLLFLPDHPDQPGITAMRLLREPLHVVLPADHRLARHDSIAPEDLSGETLLAMQRGHRLHDQIAALCYETGAALSRDYEGTSLDMLRQMVATGMGITLLPALYVRSEVLRENLVVARPLKGAAPARDVMMAWRSGTPRAAQYARLAALIAATVAEFGLPSD